MEKLYADALAEVDMILQYADEESLNRIPKEIRKMISENKSNYKANINPDKALKEQNLLYETKVILSVLYKYYWANDEEKEQLHKVDLSEWIKNEDKKNKKFKYDDLLKNNML